jgi:precorrin-6A/cobalt-precorrin-6A reductase
MDFSSDSMAPRILILGGTSEASALAAKLAPEVRLNALISFAGRTKTVARAAIPYRIGGFGGIDGLTTFLATNQVAALVDATHPFSVQISAHAVAATKAASVPLIRLLRKPWAPQVNDRWTEVDDMVAAAAALGPLPKRVFLTTGKTDIAAFRPASIHSYLVRVIDPFDPELPSARVITARGPFTVDDERALLRREKIDVVVTKNSGAAETRAKLKAARDLGIDVIVVRRPALPDARTVDSVSDAMSWLIDHHAAVPALRGE